MKSFEANIRVYYEDTDAGGVVYHANYLKFFERVRSDFLRFLGFAHLEMRESKGLVLMIKNLDIDYLKPAHLDDVLTIRSWISEIRPASLIFKHEVRTVASPETLICTGQVRIFCMDLHKKKPGLLPPELSAAYARFLTEPSSD